MKTKKRQVYFVLFVTAFLMQVVCVPRADAGAKLNLSKASNNNGLIAYWTFDGKDISGTTVRDVFGGHDGDLMGAGGASIPRKLVGKVGQAISVSGDGSTNSYVNFGPGFYGALSEATISLWVRRQGDFAGGFGPIFGDIPDDGGWVLSSGGTYGAGQSNIAFSPALADSIEGYTTSNPLQIGQWKHVVMVYNANGATDAEKIKIYVNGVQETLTFPSPVGGVGISPTSGQLQIGLDEIHGRSFNGDIDDVRFYSRALSAQEAKQLYNAGQAKSASTPKSLSSGLLHHWTFDGKDVNSTTVFDRVGTLNGTLSTLGIKYPIPVTGVVGQGMSMNELGNGNGGYIDFGTASELTTVNQMSISMWLRRNGKPWVTFGQIIGKLADQTGWTLYTGTGTGGDTNLLFLPFGLDGGMWGVTNTSPLQRREWVHVIVVFDGSAGTNPTRLKMYVNGNEEILGYVGTIPATSVGTGNLLFGNEAVNSAAPSVDVDDLRIYNRPLSATEAAQLFRLGKTVTNKTSVGIQDGLLGWWTFDGKDMSGGTVINKVNNNADGHLMNMSSSTMYARGKIGQALNFDGINDYVELGNSIPLNSSNWTVHLWWRPTQFNAVAPRRIFSYYGDGPTIYDGGDNGDIYLVHSSEVDFVCNNTLLVLKQWAMITFTRTGSTVRCYINGVMTAEDAAFAAAYTKDTTMRIGNSTAFDEPTVGNIDDVRVYNRGLTAAEVFKLYQAAR